MVVPKPATVDTKLRELTYVVVPKPATVETKLRELT